MNDLEVNPNSDAPPADLPALVIPLLKGVIYRDAEPRQWQALLLLQARVRDYMAVLGLELVLDEAEGYAFLRSRTDATDEEASKTPRLIARRPLSFPVSLLLALLRKKLAEFDARGGDESGAERLVMSVDEIAEMLRLFMPAQSNEARLIDQTQTHLNKIAELGFVRKLKSSTPEQGKHAAHFEVQRILKAFVDAQWLSEFDAKLEAYRAQSTATTQGPSDE